MSNLNTEDRLFLEAFTNLKIEGFKKLFGDTSIQFLDLKEALQSNTNEISGTAADTVASHIKHRRRKTNS